MYLLCRYIKNNIKYEKIGKKYAACIYDSDENLEILHNATM